MKVINVGNSVLFETDKIQYAFPKGGIILTSSKSSKSVNVRLKGSRKTILSFPSTDLGKETAQEAIDSILGLV